jgi:hypothetical protein
VNHLSESILTAADALPEGSLLSANAFLHLASRAAVNQALTRLTRKGKLMRIGRGVYTAPVIGRFGERPPSTDAVIKAIESTRGELIVANGAAEANALGLTTQLPSREVFLTSGRSRKLQLGNRTVELKHGHRWQLVLGKRPAGMAIRALSWLGPEQAPLALKFLHTKLPPAEWAAMRAARAVLPGWLARAVMGGGESMANAVETAAAQSLAGCHQVVLDDVQWQAFEKVLDRPLQAKPRLKKLLREPGVLG